MCSGIYPIKVYGKSTIGPSSHLQAVEIVSPKDLPRVCLNSLKMTMDRGCENLPQVPMVSGVGTALPTSSSQFLLYTLNYNPNPSFVT